MRMQTSVSTQRVKCKTRSFVSTSDALYFVHIFLRTGTLDNGYQDGTFSAQDMGQPIAHSHSFEDYQIV